MISLAAVNISEKTKELMAHALENGIVGQGIYVEQFEEAIRQFVGARYAVALASGTVADAAVLGALKYLRPEKSEVIVPALTFVAQVNAAYYNHLAPVFVDVTSDLQMDPQQLEAKITDKTLAIMPVDLLGNLAPIDSIMAIAKKHNVFVVSDSCEAFGARFDGKFAGTIADAGTYSFFPSHTITCGEGGMVVTDNEEIYQLLRSIRNHGRKSDKIEDKFVFPRIGFNGKMNCLEAIVGLGAMDRLHEYVEARHRAYLFYKDAFGVDLLQDNARKYIVPHGFPLLFKDAAVRDKAIQSIFGAGIECRKIFSAIPVHEESYRFMGHQQGDFPVAEDIATRGLYVPAHQNLKESDLEFIAKTVKPMVS